LIGNPKASNAKMVKFQKRPVFFAINSVDEMRKGPDYIASLYRDKDMEKQYELEKGIRDANYVSVDTGTLLEG